MLSPGVKLDIVLKESLLGEITDTILKQKREKKKWMSG
jgi:hypothetical protein